MLNSSIDERSILYIGKSTKPGNRLGSWGKRDIFGVYVMRFVRQNIVTVASPKFVTAEWFAIERDFGYVISNETVLQRLSRGFLSDFFFDWDDLVWNPYNVSLNCDS